MLPVTPTLYAIEATVVAVEDRGNHSEIDLYGCVFYAHDEETLLSDAPAEFTLPQLTVTVKNTFLKYLTLNESPATTTLLVECSAQGAYVRSDNKIADSLSKLETSIEYVKGLVSKGLPVTAARADAQREIDYILNTVLKFQFVPISVTRSDAMTRLEAAQEYLSSLNTYIPTQELKDEYSASERHQVLSTTDTDRKGLQDLYRENAKESPDTPVYLAFTGSLTNTQSSKTGSDNRINLRDVIIRRYDNKVLIEDSPIVERLDHLNVFVDEKTLKRVVSASEGAYLFGRLTFYRRRDRSFDFSITVLQWAPVIDWLDRLESSLTNWEERLERGTLLKSKKLKSKIDELCKLFSKPETLPLDTTTLTLDVVMSRYEALRARISKANDRYEAMASERDKDDALHRLTMEAVQHLKDLGD